MLHVFQYFYWHKVRQVATLKSLIPVELNLTLWRVDNNGTNLIRSTINLEIPWQSVIISEAIEVETRTPYSSYGHADVLWYKDRIEH